MPFSRRAFVSLTSGLGVLGISGVVPRASAQTATSYAVPAADVYPQNDPALVRDAVGSSHGNLARIRELVERQPALARASFDWGFGDWETCLDGAAHVGSKPIVELLLAHGARPTIFSAAMMGQLDVVKAFIAARPGIQKTYGPHGITLMAHAKAGGPDSAAVVQYLTAVGDADVPLATQPLAAADRDALVGQYAYGSGPRDHFTVDVQQDRLGIQRAGSPARRPLFHSGHLVFFPSGVPETKIAFARDGSRATRLTLADGGQMLTATRI